MKPKKYFDLTDLTNAVVAEQGSDPGETRAIIEMAFEKLAEAIARAGENPHDPNPVVFRGVGSFAVEAIQGRRYLVNDEFLEKPMRFKVEFYPAEKFRNIVQANLPADVKHIQVI